MKKVVVSIYETTTLKYGINLSKIPTGSNKNEMGNNYAMS